MGQFRTVLEILETSGTDKIWIIAVESHSITYRHTALAKIMEAWIRSRWPATVIEQLLPFTQERYSDDEFPLRPLADALFYVSFSDEQAKAFRTAWKRPPLCRLRPDDVLVSVRRNCMSPATDSDGVRRPTAPLLDDLESYEEFREAQLSRQRREEW